ncbi:hypothetical protein F3J20_07235 [Paraburkholderia sp. Cy-641]|uniref:hypothetical protein n=1 Tax=Paraburkholderia sp. Cy-641 TaxID=2608337 RepID=UPI0014247AEE|nr:hypothetical protein [Paraburkholderia sp. Cy-641]NIF77193.1 hypothetical protein [Paraburkholderia sp. Cy-641]
MDSMGFAEWRLEGISVFCFICETMIYRWDDYRSIGWTRKAENNGRKARVNDAIRRKPAGRLVDCSPQPAYLFGSIRFIRLAALPTLCSMTAPLHLQLHRRGPCGFPQRHAGANPSEDTS